MSALLLAGVDAAAQRSVATPRCFGAASRDPLHPCHNPRLRYEVVPSPAAAARLPNSACTWIGRYDLVHPCAFGVAAEDAPTQTIAIVGDSHAAHWRAALDVVAESKRWRGLSISRTSCPFSRATKKLPQPARRQCVRWNDEVIGWLRLHPEVKTVFVAQISGDTDVIANGRDQFSARVDGYTRAWRALPRSVERILVLRDTPRMRSTTNRCVQRAIRAHRRAAIACRVPRRRALHPDPAAVAAARTRSKRVHTVDLTRLFCNWRSCFPVIGGALVYKDVHHLTDVYATTLGRYLLRAVNRIERG